MYEKRYFRPDLLRRSLNSSYFFTCCSSDEQNAFYDSLCGSVFSLDKADDIASFILSRSDTDYLKEFYDCDLFDLKIILIEDIINDCVWSVLLTRS